MQSVYRCFTEKRGGFNVEAEGLCRELREQLGIASLKSVRILNRYDVEGIDGEIYRAARETVFSEPQCDDCYDEDMPEAKEPCFVLAVEALPGQYDQRADSCAQCIQILTCGSRPLVSAAKVYLLGGSLTEQEKERIRGHLINPVERREASLKKPATLRQEYPAPDTVPVIAGFTALNETGLEELLARYGLAMDLADLRFLQTYFRDTEGRDPTVTELKLVDTYWSDHCRHTTFATHIDRAEIEDPAVLNAYRQYLDVRREVYGDKDSARPQTLMDIATLGAKALRARGLLPMLDLSKEINACTVRVKARVDGTDQDWLVLFKNETHNHPTEIEPFGGAATCVGGAIRDPLSGRAYVYQAMRLTGCGDPRAPMADTLPGKLPQRQIAVTAAAGYSSYGNQIGLATGIVHEIYHPGYIAKHMEVGAVVGAAPAEHVVRLEPVPGDVIILLGGRTGRDGIGGATGSSKTHNLESLTECAAEVQKGNAPEERKIQRLFRNPSVTRIIKRCNDFGAGGVSVAIGELADGLDIDLSLVRKKYEGLDGTELAISESQERMAVVVAAEDAAAFIRAAEGENLEAYQVAAVTASPRLVMRWRGDIIVNVSREFLNTNGADKHSFVRVPRMNTPAQPSSGNSPEDRLRRLAADPAVCSRRGLGERFDGSIGAGSILMPYGGMTQLTPTQVMAALLPAEGETEDCTVMSFGFDPDLSLANPFLGAAAAVTESLARLTAAGCDPDTAYLTFQEYFERLRDEPLRWGKPFAALLGAFSAQMGLGVAAIGGKDSMSGSFLDLDVPPTLISFAISPAKASGVLSPEFKTPGRPVYLFSAPDGDYAGTKALWHRFHALASQGFVASAWALSSRGAAEGILKMSLGNRIGFAAAPGIDPDLFFRANCGGILAECSREVEGAVLLGYTDEKEALMLGDTAVSLDELIPLWENVLESVYPTRAAAGGAASAVSFEKRPSYTAGKKFAAPRAVIPVFPGTNCEYDTARALRRAGIEPEILVVRNLTAQTLTESVDALERSIRQSQMIVIPGGFSGGDEPDGSGKFICAFLRNPQIRDAVHELLHTRDGLVLGICNGFQALIKLGLITHGEIREVDETFPTLTYNLIGRHQSRYVTTRVASVHSPWMSLSQVGDLHAVPVSHGEGRFVASETSLASLQKSGQIATQYTDVGGRPSMDISVNPNGSLLCVEGLFSPDGRVFGKMGHIERRGDFVAVNLPGNKHMPVFESGAAYYR
ncbi:phosphoribosylformylglycinamidine synthase [Papillibacter cinnamivorans]|uniref:Phosphoribosylformylglycinamidine synthase n=1 Tax=Papillibacter cinnamivorans DSM 12816 TaxID=1122930 RepID=A0A1W2CR26_9FIRM|nr:phosphoribosylformylglycinamidine synthase [Papillibacter cinnamivorans]SMC87653.1 phosphoribosylformylglycinamidine synthase [Papillibacter cinnamivorans DSM 12816]